MWMLLVRPPQPDAPYWPGRRWLAAIDAIAWPGVAWYALNEIASTGGLVLAVAMALVSVSAARRLITALLANHRYHFTARRFARILIWMLVMGTLLKLWLPT